MKSDVTFIQIDTLFVYTIIIYIIYKKCQRLDNGAATNISSFIYALEDFTFILTHRVDLSVVTI